jgi:hypothetical protein
LELYKYQAFGLPIISEIELPALMPLGNLIQKDNAVNVKLGKTPISLKNENVEKRSIFLLNEQELLFEIEGIARYYVSDSTQVIIEPLSDKWSEILLYFYTNCIASILYQKGFIPIHASGVFVDDNSVLLISAPSGFGKSTTAIKLAELGYNVFSDDTVIVNIEGTEYCATASYPMMRQRQETIDNQLLFNENDKKEFWQNIEINKFGFYFHETFKVNAVKVVGIVFLSKGGTEVSIKELTPIAALKQLGANIYRKGWATAMNKQMMLYKHLTEISNKIPMWEASRPENEDTFNTFSRTIEEQIILKSKQKESPYIIN